MGNKRRAFWGIGFFLYLLTPVFLFGDVVVLKDGRVLEGKMVKDEGKTIVFQLRKSNMMIQLHLKKKDILKLQRSQSTWERLMKEYESRKKAALKANTIAIWEDLAKWCTWKGLTREGKNALEEAYELRKKLVEKVNTAESWYQLGQWMEKQKVFSNSQLKEIYAKVIQINPNHGQARKKLGFHRYKNQWVSEEEYERLKDEEMRLKGFVKYQGKWYRPEALKILLQIKEMESIQKFKKRLEDLEESNRLLEAEIDSLKQELESMRHKNREMKRELSRLKKELYNSNLYWKQLILSIQQSINDLYNRLRNH